MANINPIKYSDVLIIRVESEVKDQIKYAASLQKESLSEFVRKATEDHMRKEALRDLVRKVTGDHRREQPDGEGFCWGEDD